MNILSALIIPLICLLQACCAISKDERIARDLMKSFSNQQKVEKNLILIGIGGAMPDKIQSFFLHFVSKEKADIVKARSLYIDCTQKLLEKVNANQEIRPFLQNYPSTYNNLDIMIRFENETGMHTPKPNIALVLIANGDICYSVYDEHTDMLQTIHREPYEEALKIVQGK